MTVQGRNALAQYLWVTYLLEKYMIIPGYVFLLAQCQSFLDHGRV